MAKLKARGRQEVARLSKEQETPADDLISWERATVALMSDNTVLTKRDVQFRADARRHSYGWKVKGTLKAGATPAQWEAAYIARGFSR